MSETPATLDPTKMPAGALTMAYKDYYFLQRWVDYYGRQFGREHLYVLSHGGDPEHDRICEGANVIRLPRERNLGGWPRCTHRCRSSGLGSTTRSGTRARRRH